MKQFKDKKGRDWVVSIDMIQVKKLRDLVQVDLYALFTDEAKRVFADPVLLVDVMYVLCRDEAKARNMTDEDFGRAFDGDVLEAAANALLEATLDFFPSSRQTILRATVDKSQELAGQLQAQALAKIASLTVTDLLRPGGSPG